MLTAIVTETVQQASAADEIEWAQLELACEFGKHDGKWIWEAWNSRSVERTPKFTDAPHPLSYGANLPLRAAKLDKHGHPIVSLTLTAAEKKSIALRTAGVAVKAVKTAVRPNSAHPDSYRADLPLRGLGINGKDPIRKWTLTAEEKSLLADRPIRYIAR